MVDIESNILEKLKCIVCKSYLSCPPIFLTKNGDNICGRCPTPTAQNATFRNTAYEELFVMHSFPCRFKKEGCRKKLITAEVKQHEDCCEYQKINCPLLPSGSCKWSGFYQNLQQHFREKHNELIVDNPFDFKYKGDEVEENFLTTVFGFLFLIQTKFNRAEFCQSVCLIGSSKIAPQFKYNINLSKTTLSVKDNKIVKNMSKINDFSDAIIFDIGALKLFFKSFEDLSFSLKIFRHEVKCVSCLQTIMKTTRGVTVECEIFCQECNPEIPTTEKQFQPCISNMDGCTYMGNAKNMPKHYQWFCSYRANNICHFCYNDIKSETKIQHLMSKCNKILVIHSTSPTNEVNVNEQAVIVRTFIFGKVFFCIFYIKKKSLVAGFVSACPKEDLEDYFVEFFVESNGSNVKRQRLERSEDANSDWKGTFSVGLGAANVKYIIKKTT